MIRAAGGVVSDWQGSPAHGGNRMARRRLG
ncbi:MAG: hypothetical protein U1E55_10575 [Paracoccus sp. (in: a-proteobacteria)]